MALVAPSGFTEPLRVAAVALTPVAGNVVTLGAVAAVVVVKLNTAP
jgi:hypothetical protein